MRLNVTIEDPDRRVAYALDVSFDLDAGDVALNPIGTRCPAIYDEFDGTEMLSITNESQSHRLGRKVCREYADEIRGKIVAYLDDCRENAIIERAERRAGL